MTRAPQHTFIGPVTSEKTARGKPRAFYFLLLQAGGTPLKLEYSTEGEAYGARRTLLQNPLTYSVHSNKLLQGIQQALDQALLAGQKLLPRWDKTGDEQQPEDIL